MFIFSILCLFFRFYVYFSIYAFFVSIYAFFFVSIYAFYLVLMFYIFVPLIYIIFYVSKIIKTNTRSFKLNT